jgi:tetratricopeptide (TPR) repeat protein
VTGSPDYRSQLLGRLCSVYRAARDKGFSGVADDLRAFAFKRFSGVIQRDLNNYPPHGSQLAQTLHDLAGPRDGLAFLIGQIEREPRWLRYANQDGWNQYAGTLTQWRHEAPDLGDLEPRLLKIVLAELRADLQSRQSRNDGIYRRDHSYYGYFWTEKEGDFARLAEEVYAGRNDSGAAVSYLANYLYHGLQHHDRAIEMLLATNGRGLLEESAQSQLVTYLHERNRHGESIAILLPLVERRPDVMNYRCLLMRAYFHTQQPARLLALLQETDEYFHKDGRWNEGNIAQLAQACLDTQLYEQLLKYYNEVIPMHQRSQPNRGIGDGTLSNYYTQLSLGYAGLKKTAEAVEAACGAIVSWGPRHDQRGQALSRLKDVISQAPNLDAYVVELDKKTAETGLDNTVVRKAIGQVYLERKKLDQAIVQLNLALELQANDAEIHQALIVTYDQKGDKEGVIHQVLRSLQLSRRDINLYKELGNRYTQLEQPKQAERAYTSIVEMLPNDSEGHAALAEIRQGQNRWTDAIDQWQQVARIRALEPTGLLKTAEAQLHEKQWNAAADTLRHLEAKSWPTRFGDVPSQARQLWQHVEEGRKAK